MANRISHICFALVLFLPGLVAAQGVRINEFMASNGTSVPEFVDFGDYEDWIELYNAGTATVDLGGYTLTDDLALPAKWVFPSGSVIPPSGFFLVWADGLSTEAGTNGVRPWWPGNTAFTTRWNHASFRLSRTQESIYLFDSAGALADSVSYLSQLTDVSTGRFPDGSSQWFSFGESTPLAPNSTPALVTSTPAARVTLLPSAGLYSGAVQVSISNPDASGTVFYTLDGSRPTRASARYSGPFVVSGTTTVRARLIVDGVIPGPVATSTYLIGTHHALPIVSLASDPDLLWHSDRGIYLNSLKDREVPVHFEFFESSSLAIGIDAGARIGGENVFRFAQKPLNLYFRTDYGTSHLDYRVFEQLPLTEWKRLYLRNGGDDWPHTMMRDGFQATLLAGLPQSAVQAYRPSVLYLNGDYWGIYNLREKIDEQYFRLHASIDPVNLDHLESNTRVIAGDSTDYVALLAFAETQDLRVAANYAYVADRVDLRSLMDFVIAQSFVANGSWGHNREMWRDRGSDGKWKWVIVDMDRGYDINRVASATLADIRDEFDLFNRLIQNESFRTGLISRYALHLNTTFRSDRAIRIIDSLSAAIALEMPAHSSRWGPYIDSLSIPQWGIEPGIQSVDSWKSAVNNLRRFAAERPSIAADQVVSLFGLPGTAEVTLGISPPSAGRLLVEGSEATANASYKLFQGIPVNLQAEPAPGYAFLHWIERRVDGQATLLAPNATWKYLDQGEEPVGGWTAPAFDDSGWATGAAELGYGDGDEATVVSFGPDAQNKYITTWFRAAFEVSDASEFSELTLELVRDDGAVVYLNGTEIVRSNMPEGPVNALTEAGPFAGGAEESQWYRFTVNTTALQSGSNVLAVELHQSDGQSSDISFNLSLSATRSDPTTQEVIVDEEATLSFSPSGDATLTAVFDANTVTRLPATVSADRHFSAADSPVLVEGAVSVQPGVTLSAGPGVVFEMADGADLLVLGRLELLGTESQPIQLRSVFADRTWGSVCLTDASGASVLEHVNISGAAGSGECLAAVSTFRSELSFVGGSFSDVALPVYSLESGLTVDGVHFSEVTDVGDYITADGGVVSIRNSTFVGNALEDMDAIDLGLLNPGSVVADNVIFGFSGSNSDGIDLGEGSRDVLIEGNRIYDIADKGVSIGQGSSGILKRNVIARTLLGVGVKDSLSSAHVEHTTFVQNGTGVAVFEKNPGRGGAFAAITGSLFSGSTTMDISADLASTLDVAYSLTEDPRVAGTGNRSADARLLHPDGLNVYLQFHSPAIDSGDPDLPRDPDGSVADIGAYPFAGTEDGAIVVNEINYHSEAAFNTDDWIELTNRSSDPVGLDGWVLIDGGHASPFVFEPGISLAPGDFLLAARDLALFASLFPVAGPLVGPLTRGLGGSGDALYLYDERGVLVDSVAYLDIAPWPLLPDGNGPSLELLSPERDNALAVNWGASSGHGTPGARNSIYVVDVESESDVPTSFTLAAPYPNPFNPSTSITYAIAEPSRVVLRVFDMLGRHVQTLVDDTLAPGSYTVRFVAGTLPSGVYMMALTAEAGVSGQTHRFTRTVILAK